MPEEEALHILAAVRREEGRHIREDLRREDLHIRAGLRREDRRIPEDHHRWEVRRNQEVHHIREVACPDGTTDCSRRRG